jgi:hypothetical protein
MRSDTPCPASIKAGAAFARLVRRADAFSTRVRHMLNRTAQAWSSSSNSISAGAGSAHSRGGCSLMTSANLLAFMIGIKQGLFRCLNDNRIQFALPAFQRNFIDERPFHSLWVEDF